MAPDSPVEERWQPRRVSAWLLRALIFLGPLAVGFAAGAFVSRLLPEPTTAYQILTWWIAVIVAATIAATGVDRLARRLLPLTVLLKMTMLFPDRAPSRLKMARRAGNPSELRRRIEQAEQGGSTDMAEMAELILSLSAALSNHDRKTRGHSERTRAYTELLADELGLSEVDRDKLRWAALLHDVGKLEVPTEILNKDSALTEDEWHQVRQHPIHGMHLVAPLIPWLGPWAKTIEHHHERWDGSGYPHGLAGTDISLGARIVSVADAYDVMTSGRSYQRAKSPAHAREEVAKMAGQQFDPMVARALMSVSLGKLRWSTGPLAVLAEIPFLRGLPQVGRDVITVLTSSAVMTTSLVIGAVPAPLDIAPEEIVNVVIAGAGLGDIPNLALPEAGERVDRPSAVTTTTSPPTSTTTSTTPATTTTTPSSSTAPIATDITSPGAPPPSTTTTLPGGTTTTTPPTTTTTAPTTSNRPPLAAGDAATLAEDTTTALAVLANDTDADGNLDPGSLAITTPPGDGSAGVSSGRVIYTPAPNWFGDTSLEYRICDTDGACATGQARLTITPVNDEPVVPPVVLVTPHGTLVSGPLPYSDVDGDALRCTLATAPNVGAATVPSDCSRVTYQPPANFSGDVSIAIDVADGSTTIRAAVTVIVLPPNRAPVAVDDKTNTYVGQPIRIPVLANDSDPDGDPITIGGVRQPTVGTAKVSGSAVLYTPPTSGAGMIRFTYDACDPSGACSTATVSVRVTPAPANNGDASTGLMLVATDVNAV